MSTGAPINRRREPDSPREESLSLGRKDRRIWGGLVGLVLGLALMDRSFAVWRNGPLNPMHAGGAAASANHAAASLLLAVAGVGLVLFLGSTLLLNYTLNARPK